MFTLLEQRGYNASTDLPFGMAATDFILGSQVGDLNNLGKSLVDVDTPFSNPISLLSQKDLVLLMPSFNLWDPIIILFTIEEE